MNNATLNIIDISPRDKLEARLLILKNYRDRGEYGYDAAINFYEELLKEIKLADLDKYNFFALSKTCNPVYKNDFKRAAKIISALSSKIEQIQKDAYNIRENWKNSGFSDDYCYEAKCVSFIKSLAEEYFDNEERKKKAEIKEMKEADTLPDDEVF